jgi:hypothetical protein
MAGRKATRNVIGRLAMLAFLGTSPRRRLADVRGGPDREAALNRRSGLELDEVDGQNACHRRWTVKHGA